MAALVKLRSGPLQCQGIEPLRPSDGDDQPGRDFQQAEETLDQDCYQIGRVGKVRFGQGAGPREAGLGSRRLFPEPRMRPRQFRGRSNPEALDGVVTHELFQQLGDFIRRIGKAKHRQGKGGSLTNRLRGIGSNKGQVGSRRRLQTPLITRAHALSA